MLVNSKEILLKARKENYAIPATNFIDLDSARTFVTVAEKLNKPLILPFAQAHKEIISLEEAALIGKYLAEKVSVPVVLHLDHGEDFNFIKRAIELGFTSVMIDASKESLENNIKITKEVVDYAHQKNVTVEAELGHVGAGTNYENHETTDSVYTEVKDVQTFLKNTDVDSLAVSIGTAHGAYKGTPILNFERLAEIREITEVPLVLHGGSSSGNTNLNRCAVSGIAKINIFTDFLNAAYKKNIEGNPRDYLEMKFLANEAMSETLEGCYKVFATKSIN
ncbi:class II fructose-bisphosphate aldolase [Enterococcus xiangfangensis]|uniref:Class II fructose-bisphosphate aldolase n=1 Tax=Enterococcus xiangfangensis TaxID=1296537 RepID=A0ABU3FCS6_9ENTE|nr:class II fructose-bisphosphate aldolase [Enterococcus xiangfangensis]MDT2760466.1 class II fructose-bisphosphate aldolase [Enterococcus xiangfangensis]